MLRKLSAVLLIVAMVFVIGCSGHTHKVGHGAVFNRTTVERQWYILYGLVPSTILIHKQWRMGRGIMKSPRRLRRLTTFITSSFLLSQSRVARSRLRDNFDNVKL